MKTGKCWIYKRAFNGDQEIDYTDGTKPFDCSVDVSGDFPVYHWKVGNTSLPILLNVPHTTTKSIVNRGTNGDIEYEFLYGKFRTYPEYYLKVLKQCGMLVVISALITFLVEKWRRSR